MYSAQIIADSIAPNGVRLTTMQVTFPRFILAEFNTHRQFSRNSASSRAIPVAKRIAEVRSNPFVPEAFTANKKGMQGGDALTGFEAERARSDWLMAAEDACLRADSLLEVGVHKQYANRLLEPFLWHTAVVSATEWSNFFAQRCHPAAQPEIQNIAYMMREALEISEPERKIGREWHLPYSLSVDFEHPVEDVQKVSVARCARVSYVANTEDGSPGVRDFDADIRLYDRLLTSGHWSPFEHVATPLASTEPFFTPRSGNFRGWHQFRKEFSNECR